MAQVQSSLPGGVNPELGPDATGVGWIYQYALIDRTGGHDLSAIAVLEEQVDVAFVATHRLDNVLDRGLATMDDYNVIWSSPVIPQDPFVVSGKLCDDLVAQITDAFLTLDDSKEGQDYLKNVNASKFVAMTDEDYDIIRALKAAKDAKK